MAPYEHIWIYDLKNKHVTPEFVILKNELFLFYFQKYAKLC